MSKLQPVNHLDGIIYVTKSGRIARVEVIGPDTCKERGWHNWEEFIDPESGGFHRCKDCGFEEDLEDPEGDCGIRIIFSGGDSTKKDRDEVEEYLSKILGNPKITRTDCGQITEEGANKKEAENYRKFLEED